MESTKITYNKELQINKQKDIQTADNISQICCLHVELIPRALKLWEEHKTLQNTVNNYIFQSWQQWTSIAFRGTSGLYPYIYIHIYMIYVMVLAISCNIQQYSNRRCRVSWICQVNSPWKRCWVRGALDKSGVDGASQLTGDRGLDG